MDTVESAGVVEVDVRNVGGIDRTRCTFEPGITVLTGENATNRTSFLTSLMAALGSDRATLKSDAEEGEVRLSFDGETYTRTFERTGDRVSMGGDPYLDDPTVADLFAFLLESNEARRAVRSGADLRELVMRPVDTDEIRAEIDRLEEEKRRLDDELADLDDLEAERADLVDERERLADEIEEVEADLDARRAELADLDASVEESKSHREQRQEKFAELESAREDLERTRRQLETERESLASLREERAELETRRDELPDASGDRLAEIESELDRLREHKRSLESTISRLGEIVQFNESMVDGADAPVEELTERDDDVTARLLPDDDEVVCWTCGSEVEESAIENTLDRLRDLRQETVSQRREIGDEIDDLQSEQRDLESTREERERVDRRLSELDAEIDRRTENVEELTASIEDLEARVEDLEDAVRERDEREYEEVIERHRAVNELEFELESLRDDREAVEDEIGEIDARLDERGEIEARREEVAAELQVQRTRIERLEAELIETFNDRMAEVLSLLDYDGIDRIWIEVRERETREGRRKVTERVFDLHIVRRGDDGGVYEDTVDTLSESEREVAGLVFALAGYLAHDLDETVPFVVLDSLEAIDGDRIGRLLEYFADHTRYLVVALLEADAAAVDDSHERIQMG
ncbi:archaea-specific SMC-related protein (plasmid) [Halorientalis pallida]|uniref:archaea-specific SMC-related protein n=1 Tax=Halorientalis pallida TaxID=2479928 RepID=UPI003C6F474F